MTIEVTLMTTTAVLPVRAIHTTLRFPHSEEGTHFNYVQESEITTMGNRFSHGGPDALLHTTSATKDDRRQLEKHTNTKVDDNTRVRPSAGLLNRNGVAAKKYLQSF